MFASRQMKIALAGSALCVVGKVIQTCNMSASSNMFGASWCSSDKVTANGFMIPSEAFHCGGCVLMVAGAVGLGLAAATSIRKFAIK